MSRGRHEQALLDAGASGMWEVFAFNRKGDDEAYNLVLLATHIVTPDSPAMEGCVKGWIGEATPAELNAAYRLAIALARISDFYEARAEFRKRLAATVARRAQATAPVVDQPAPAPSRSPAIWDLVVADMHERDATGQQRYGTRLQAHNGRDSLVDAYQESLDLTVYLRQAIYERTGK